MFFLFLMDFFFFGYCLVSLFQATTLPGTVMAFPALTEGKNLVWKIKNVLTNTANPKRPGSLAGGGASGDPLCCGRLPSV